MRSTIKLNRLILLLAICFSTLCSCVQSDSIEPIDQIQSVSVNAEHAKNLTLKYTPSNSNDYCLKTIDLNEQIKNDEVLGCITASDGCIYYEVCKVDPLTTNYLSCSIYKFDLASAASEPIVYIESDKPFYTNELVLVGDSLFWVYRDSDKVKIDYYTLSNGKHGTIKEYSGSTSDLILSGDTRFLTWYVPYENGIQLFCFDTKNKNIENLTKIATTDSPYTRAYVNNGIVAFLEKHKDGRLLVMYDLIEQKRMYTCLLSDEFMLTRLQANTDHIICTEGYSRNSPLFLLDPSNWQFVKIDLDTEDYGIFSCHLYENFIVVNTGLSKKLILCSLSDGVYTSFNSETNIIQASISPDGLFYGCSPESKSIFILDIPHTTF